MAEIVFPRIPDAEAIRAIERRGGNFVPTGPWTDLWQKDHQTAFTVAQSTGFDILKDIHAAIIRAMQDGIPFEKFRRDITRVLQAKGWWGKTDDGRWLGTPWRLKTIFQTNLRVSSAQGDWRRAQDGKASRPYLRYTALLDGRTRPLHRSWHGVILPVDDPWWETHYPPNGFNCRCKALSVGPESLALYGWKVSEKAPDDGFEEWENPNTGETRLVPKGVDPGFDYNPGDTDQSARAAKLAMDKLAAMPPKMGAAAITALALSFPQVVKELTGWIARTARQIREKDYREIDRGRRVVGAVSDEFIAFAREKGLDLPSAAISIDEKDLMHALREHKVKPLSENAWANLPYYLLDAEEVYWDNQEPGLIYVIQDADGPGKFIVLINYKYKDKNQKEKMWINTVRTGRKIDTLNEFIDDVRYTKIKE